MLYKYVFEELPKRPYTAVSVTREKPEEEAEEKEEEDEEGPTIVPELEDEVEEQDEINEYAPEAAEEPPPPPTPSKIPLERAKAESITHFSSKIIKPIYFINYLT